MKVITFEKVSFSDIKIVRLFVNALTADGEHYLLNRNNLRQPIQRQLSQKQKTFSQLSFVFLKSILISTHFPQKEDPHSSCISEIKGCEYWKWVQTLLQSER